MCVCIHIYKVLPWWLSSKESTGNVGGARDAGLIPGSGRSPGGENGTPLQYSCLKTSWMKSLSSIQFSHSVMSDS